MSWASEAMSDYHEEQSIYRRPSAYRPCASDQLYNEDARNFPHAIALVQQEIVHELPLFAEHSAEPLDIEGRRSLLAFGRAAETALAIYGSHTTIAGDVAAMRARGEYMEPFAVALETGNYRGLAI